jgi:hypothetical protein
MEELIKIIPQITSVFALVAFGVAAYGLYHIQNLNKSNKNISLADPKDRPDLIRQELKKNSIEGPKGELSPEAYDDHWKRTLEYQDGKDKRRIYAGVILGIGLLILLAYTSGIPLKTEELTPAVTTPKETTDAETEPEDIPVKEGPLKDTTAAEDTPDEDTPDEVIPDEVPPDAVTPPVDTTINGGLENDTTDEGATTEFDINLKWNEESFKRIKYISASDQLLKENGGDQWSSGALSLNYIPLSLGGKVSHEISSPKQQYMIGLSENDFDVDYTSMSYGLSIQQKGQDGQVQANVFEHGNNMKVFNAEKGDVLTISKSITGNVVYFRNDLLIYESKIRCVKVLHVDVGIKTYPSEVSGITISGSWKSN